MYTHTTLWRYFIQASVPLQLVFVALFIISLIVWTIILQRGMLFSTVNRSYVQFERKFWSEIQLDELYKSLPETIPSEHVSAIFYVGFTEFLRLHKDRSYSNTMIVEEITRVMHIAHTQAELGLGRQLNWLGISASVTPYVGLLGSILGIIYALTQLGDAGQVNALLLIAPGISDALMVSALSLLTSIPALLFYHGYINYVDRLLKQYHIFQEEFLSLILKQIHKERHEKPSSS